MDSFEDECQFTDLRLPKIEAEILIDLLKSALNDVNETFDDPEVEMDDEDIDYKLNLESILQRVEDVL